MDVDDVDVAVNVNVVDDLKIREVQWDSIERPKNTAGKLRGVRIPMAEVN